MKNIFLLLTLLLLISCGSESKPDSTEIKWEKMTSFIDVNGRSASYSGYTNEGLIVAGGCNFPTTPVYDGGKKVFYDDIYTLKENNWVKSNTKLPAPMAYGVSSAVGNVLYVIGGTSDGKVSLNGVYSYSSGEIKSLAPMPKGKDNMSGASIGKKIYVAGGLTDGIATNEVYVYDTELNSWSEIAPYPGEARVQPVLVAQNAAEEVRLYLFGGFNPDTKNIMRDGWAYSPKEKRWIQLDAQPVTSTGGVGVATGVHTILVTGGVNDEKFAYGLAPKSDSLKRDYLMQDPSWYKFNNQVYAYNTIIDKWSVAGDAAIARAGATLSKGSNGWYVVMGETKPGVRSNEVWYGKLIPASSFGWINWTVVVVYLLAMIGMGIFFMFRAKSSDDFFKASGRIPWWAVSVSIFATMLSAITFMAIPAKTYATDWKYFMMAITILIAAFPVVKYYLPFFRRLNITSAYEYLELRFNKTLRVASSVIFIIFMIARMALILYLPSLALVAATGIDIYTCILLMSLITIIYSSIGGVEAVIWGDVIQGIILMGGALFALFFMIVNTDGSFVEIALDKEKFNIINLDFDFTNATFWVVVLGGFATQIISYTSDQTVIQRYMTVKSEKQASKSIITNGVMSIISSITFYFIGTALFTYYQSQPELLDISMPTADSVFPFFIMTRLPVGVAGILISAIFAASMSTVSSNINSIATAYTVDIQPLLKPINSDAQKLRIARYASLISGVIGCLFALMLATWSILSILDWFNSMLGLLTSGLGALFFIGVFFDRIGGRAALIGFVSGTVLLVLITLYTNLSFLMYGFTGMTMITIISLIVSYVVPRDNKDLQGLTWKLRPSKK